MASHLILIADRINGTIYDNGGMKFHKRLSLSSIKPNSEYKIEAMITYNKNHQKWRAFCKRGHSWYMFEKNLCIKVRLSEVLKQNPYLLIYELTSRVS
jgi:hypothetical protein